MQRKEEQPKKLKKVEEKELSKSVSTIYVPLGMISHEKKFPCSLCDCFSFIVHQVMHIRKKKTSLKLEEINPPNDPS